MNQPPNEPVPEEKVDVPGVRPQGAMCTTSVLLKFFQYAGSFPRAPQDVPLTAVDHLAQQVGVPTDVWAQYAWDGRTIEYHRAQIRQHLGFREATVADGETLVTWLCAQILPTTRRPDHLKEAVAQRCRDLCIEPPTPERLDAVWGAMLG